MTNPRLCSTTRCLLLLLVVVAIASSCGSGDGAEESQLRQVHEIVDRLNQYWADTDSDLGFHYEPITDDRLSVGDDGVTCDGEEVRAEDVSDNAFVDPGCREGILVAYDPEYLAAGLARMEGTLSHEWGHVVQAQAAELDLSLDAEAGLEALRSDLARAGDPSDVDLEASDAHGTADERTIAFDLGYERGPEACVFELVDRLPG